MIKLDLSDVLDHLGGADFPPVFIKNRNDSYETEEKKRGSIAKSARYTTDGSIERLEKERLFLSIDRVAA